MEFEFDDYRKKRYCVSTVDASLFRSSDESAKFSHNFSVSYIRNFEIYQRKQKEKTVANRMAILLFLYAFENLVVLSTA